MSRWRCGDPTFLVPLCASCRLAGAYGVALAAVVGFVLKLIGVLP